MLIGEGSMSTAGPATFTDNLRRLPETTATGNLRKALVVNSLPHSRCAREATG